MKVRVTKTDAKTLQITTDHPDQLSVCCLEVGRVLKLNVKFHVDEMEIGETTLIDTHAMPMAAKE